MTSEHRLAQYRAYRARRKERLKDDPAAADHLRHVQRQSAARARAKPENRIKINARARVRNRVGRFKTWPRPEFFLCSDCNDKALEYHHEDYNLWWSVEPLCKACHAKRHKLN